MAAFEHENSFHQNLLKSGFANSLSSSKEKGVTIFACSSWWKEMGGKSWLPPVPFGRHLSITDDVWETSTAAPLRMVSPHRSWKVKGLAERILRRKSLWNRNGRSVTSSADQNATKLHGVSLFTSHDDIFTLNISVIETCLLVASRDSSAWQPQRSKAATKNIIQLKVQNVSTGSPWRPNSLNSPSKASKASKKFRSFLKNCGPAHWDQFFLLDLVEVVAFFASLVCSHVLTRKSSFGAVHVMQRKFGNSYSTYLSTFLTRGHSFKIFWYWALSSACTSTAVRASSIRTSARSEHTSQTIWNVQGTSLNQVAGVFHPYGFSSHSFQRNSNLFAEILLSTNGTKGRVLLALSCRPDVKGRCFHTNEPKTPAVELVCKHCLKFRKFKKYQKNNEISKCQKFNDTSKSRKCLMSSMCFQTFDFFVWMFDFLILNCWVFECSMLLLNLVYIFCLILSNVSISDLFIVYWIFTLRGCRAFWLLSIHENGRYKCFGAFTCLCLFASRPVVSQFFHIYRVAMKCQHQPVDLAYANLHQPLRSNFPAAEGPVHCQEMFRISQAKFCFNFWMKYDVLMLNNQAAMKLQKACNLYLYTIFIYRYIVCFPSTPLARNCWDGLKFSSETFTARGGKNCISLGAVSGGINWHQHEETAIRFHQMLCLPNLWLSSRRVQEIHLAASRQIQMRYQVACYVSTLHKQKQY